MTYKPMRELESREYRIDKGVLLEENRLLKERLRILEKYTDQLFAELEDRVMKNTREIAEKKVVLQKIFNLMDGEIILADKSYRIIEASNVSSGHHAWQAASVCKSDAACQAMKTGRAVSQETALRDGNDQLRIIRQTAFPIFDSKMNESWGFVQFTQDITSVRIEQDRQIRLEKVQAVERVVALFSSYLKTIAEAAQHIILGKIGKKLGLSNYGFKDFLALLDQQIIQVQDYLTDLFFILNERTEDAVLTNVNDLLQVTLRSSKLTALSNKNKKVKIILELARDIPLVRVSQAQLSRVFIHLIDNAFDSMPAGGELTIVTRSKSLEVEIEFSDTGLGIAEQIREKIFEPFLTTKENRLGLGLSVCKFILEKYHGQITLQPNPTAGRTTSFLVRIPASLDCQACKR
ncbi:MAG: hypothetical protein K6U11_14025 [bacterium]|nr:hypothetical protein [bacterium]